MTADDLVGEAAAPEDRPWVSGIMVSSLDGRATLEGTSRKLGGPQDLQMLLALRRRADALIVGPGTVAAEGYGPLPCPAVLVSRSFELPWEAGLFAAPGQRVLVYTFGHVSRELTLKLAQQAEQPYPDLPTIQVRHR